MITKEEQTVSQLTLSVNNDYDTLIHPMRSTKRHQVCNEYYIMNATEFDVYVPEEKKTGDKNNKVIIKNVPKIIKDTYYSTRSIRSQTKYCRDFQYKLYTNENFSYNPSANHSSVFQRDIKSSKVYYLVLFQSVICSFYLRDLIKVSLMPVILEDGSIKFFYVVEGIDNFIIYDQEFFDSIRIAEKELMLSIDKLVEKQILNNKREDISLKQKTRNFDI